MTKQPDDLDAVNAIRAHFGMPAAAGHDLDAARTGLLWARNALSVMLWAVRRDGDSVPVAVDIAAADPDELAALPFTAAMAVSGCLTGLVDGETQNAIRQRCRTVLVEWQARTDAATREAIEKAIWRLAGVLWVALDVDDRMAAEQALAANLAAYAPL